MFYFARRGNDRIPEAIFTGRFIFISPNRFHVDEIDQEADKIRKAGIKNYLLTRPITELQKTLYEEALHSWLNKKSSAYRSLNGMRYAARWRWITYRDEFFVESYYTARCVYYGLMNSLQESIAGKLEHELEYDFARLAEMSIDENIHHRDVRFWQEVRNLELKTTFSIWRWRHFFHILSDRLSRPASIIVVAPTPGALVERNITLGAGDYPADAEMGFDGDWKTFLRAKTPGRVFMNRIASPEFYRRNKFADDAAWAQLKFKTERKCWTLIKQFPDNQDNSFHNDFDIYKATIINFASEWASLNNYTELVDLFEIENTGLAKIDASERYRKAVNFFYLHEN
jgi:hypothetical protein